ncbi:hypothetical protein [Methylobacillus flagellatus]|uniref:Transmembrane protein n=1 Tax=Methylobacillus flagellatus (strain ATCC 51484 / DSM 6875 / VKM B-1610 / KT) TaxID=265072 RepID=Q1H1C3_METFK|nr:hypothetical protein [Methylobacillus flagellatus]ABE49714.1 hypothetical protein Mfla_1446 [Methylobacillus flagellatus KT]
MRDPIKIAEHNPSFALTLLWLCILAGPVSWSMQLAVAYPILDWTCRQEQLIPVHAATLLAFLLSVTSAYLSWHNLKLHKTLARINENPQSHKRGSESESEMPPRQFMALAGFMLSLFFLLVIVIQWLPVLMLDPCI